MKQESRNSVGCKGCMSQVLARDLEPLRGRKPQNVPLHSDVHTAKACQGHGVVWNSLWLLCIGTGIPAAAAANETYS